MTRPHAGIKATQQETARIAITGMGFISPVGGNAWELAMRKKRSSFFSHETVLRLSAVTFITEDDRWAKRKNPHGD